jgi:transposase
MITTIKNTNIKNRNGLVIGVDVGLTNWITLSDGQVIDRPKVLTKSLKKIESSIYRQGISHLLRVDS